MKDDAISRQAVLKLLYTLPPEEAITKALLIQSVKQMDAAQPDGPDNLVKDSQGLAKDLVNDTISRQAAIDIVRFECGEWEGLAKTIIKRFEQLPSTQSESKKGEWIDYTEDGYVECPFCHNATNCDGNKDELHFCFSCGADMREVSE